MIQFQRTFAQETCLTGNYQMEDSKVITNFRPPKLREVLIDEFKKAEDIRIATGYVGWSTIEEFYGSLQECVANLGSVKLLIGMAFWEGLSARTFEALARVNKMLKEHNDGSGVYFCVDRRFHGKFYLTERGLDNFYAIGSSNFSHHGVDSNHEANLAEWNSKAYTALSRYFRNLMDRAVGFEDVNIHIKGKKSDYIDSASLKPTSIFFDVAKSPVSFALPIKITPKSNINLYCGAGRKNSSGKYSLRPFFEVEINISKVIAGGRISRFIPNLIEPYRFRVVTDTQNVMDAVIKRKFSKGNQNQNAGFHKTGGDFFTEKRVELGRYIKGHLMEQGALNYGQMVTEEMLEECNAQYLLFHKIQEDVYGISLSNELELI